MVILFDAVGTLIHPKPGVAEAYARVGRRFGSRLDEPQVLARFRAAWARQERLDFQRWGQATNQARERDRWRAIVAETLDDATDKEAAFAALWDHFAQPEHWRLDEDAPKLLEGLRARGFALGVASNFDRRLESICRGLPPLADGLRLFVSSRLGWKKPSPQFFAAVERELGLAPEEILLVGDDLENDYRAARAAGWRAVLLDRGGTSEARPRITRLAELPALVAPA